MADTPRIWRVSKLITVVLLKTMRYYCGEDALLIALSPFHSCAERVTCKTGEEMYNKSRDQLKEMLGSSGVRLYSQLQTDKARVNNINR